MDLEQLRPFCNTTRQHEVLDAVIEHGSQRKAAKALGAGNTTINNTMAAIRRKAAMRRGPLPDIAPEGYMGIGATLPDPYVHPNGTLQIGPDGKVERYWPRYKVDDQQRLKMIEQTIQDLMEDVPRVRPTPLRTRNHLPSLLNLYIITDYHLGMKSWINETGANWDIEIAEDLLLRWFKAAIKQSPKSGKALLCLLGDFLHWDGIDAVTPSSGHLLDVDTRFKLLVPTAGRIVREIIRMLLKKYPEVHIVIAEGNHDMAGSKWMATLVSMLFENDPRVTVDMSDDIYYAYEHGLTGLFFHHGHKRKVKEVSKVFASKFREMFGRTKFSYSHGGHLHFDERVEDELMISEQHRTLAAPDAYASRGGWMSGRSAKCITYHEKFGQCGLIEISPEMLYEED